MAQVIATYCAAWNELDPQRREQSLRRFWPDASTYTDPTVQATGPRELLDHIARVLQQFPGSNVVMTSALDAHHGLVRFAWKRVLGDGTSRPEGIDFVELSPDGRLQRVIGFFGPLARL